VTTTTVASAATTTSENFEAAVPALPEAEITRALADAWIELDVGEVIGAALNAFVQAGYPGVVHESDYGSYRAACEDALWSLAEAEAESAGFNVNDPDVRDSIIETIWHATQDFDPEEHRPTFRGAFQAPRDLPVVIPNIVDTSIVWRMIGRAPRLRTNHRTGGSRRTTGSGSSSSGEDGEPGPRSPSPGRRGRLDLHDVDDLHLAGGWGR
jgi:hypothetical protein